MSEFRLPSISTSKELIERIQFSVSSRNAEAKVSECVAHVFGAKYAVNPADIRWQYLSSGVACLLRSKELAKGGRKYVWTLSLCLYNVTYGVLVWKGKLGSECSYTSVSDNYHIFELSELNVLIGVMFSDRLQAGEHYRTYKSWHDERIREERSKGSNTPPQQGPRFFKDMISRPCNFQHIQGTQAIDECLEIEKIKSDIQAAIWGLVPRGQSEPDVGAKRSGSGRKKKELAKPKLQFEKIDVPLTLSSTAPTPPGLMTSPSPILSSPTEVHPEGSLPYFTEPHGSLPYATEPQGSLPYATEPQESLPYGPEPQRMEYNSSLEYQQQTFSSPPPVIIGSPEYDQLGSSVADPIPMSPPGGLGMGQQTHSYSYDNPIPTSPPVANGYPYQENYQPYPTNPTSPNGYSGYEGSQPNPNGYSGYEGSQPNAHLDVNTEVQQYMGGGEGSQGSYNLDLSPSGRLSPLNLENDFAAEIFASTIMSSH